MMFDALREAIVGDGDCASPMVLAVIAIVVTLLMFGGCLGA